MHSSLSTAASALNTPKNAHPLLVFCSCLYLSSHSIAATIGCNPLPSNALEKVYCKIKAKGEGAALPSFNEFKRNPTTTQRLLLKRYARKLGLSLPPLKTHSTSLTTQKFVKNTQTESMNHRRKTPTSKPLFRRSLAECKLKHDEILCRNGSFRLSENKSNNNITKTSLSSENVLSLPKRKNHAFISLSERQYLTRIYPIYIEKMLELGIADGTMPFTRFASHYEQITLSGGDFVTRMATMYELLKSEKKSRKMAARYNHSYPKSLDDCDPLPNEFTNRDIIVCDNVRHNWIYVKQ